MTLKKTLAIALVLIAAGASVADAKEKKPAAKPAHAAAQSAPAQAGGPQQSQIDSQKDWNAYTYSDNGGASVCYANSKPKKSEPATAKRNAVYFFITNRPAQNVKSEISIAMGYPLKPDSDVTLEIGPAKFTMFTKDDFAWVRNAADQPRIIAAMKGGKELVVKGTSKRGTQTTDTYSLAGISAVLNSIDTKCK